MIKSQNGPGHIGVCDDEVSAFFCFFFCSLWTSPSPPPPPPPLYGGVTVRIMIGATLMLIVD
jgi:hypothetical protein